MSYKDYNWEHAANDYNSPYLRNVLWTRSFTKYPKLHGVSTPVLGIESRRNQIEYLADFATWLKAHEELKGKILKDYREFETLIQKSLDWGEEINRWTDTNILKKDLTGLSGNELMSLLKHFTDRQEDEYTYGTAISILDFLDFSFIENNLNSFLKSKMPAEKFQDYYAVFTEPPNSFAQDQEEDLLRLMEASEGNYTSAQFKERLTEHTKKYCWVYYVYGGPAFTEDDFLNFIHDYEKRGINPTKKLKELQDKKDTTAKLKAQYLRELQPDEFNAFILGIAGRVIWAKPRRKDYQSKSYYHIEKLLREIAGRLKITFEQTRSSPFDLLEKALRGEPVDWSVADSIFEHHICLPNEDGTVTTLVGSEAEEFSRTYVKRKKEGGKEMEVTELKGTVACRGEARGVVKIVNVPEDMGKMEYGDILVSTATTPSIVAAMKRAAAIVTDEGGLTCHASIVSRELKIPCVVGVKIATRVFKDGDYVEVDAQKGIVRLVSNTLHV